ncbi:MAG: serine/threonine-protein kinase, partial [Planctomycetia bacterium]
MEIKKKCPTRKEIVEFTHGNLSLDELDSIARHLDTCPDCEALAATVEVGRLQKMLQTASSGSSADTYENEAEFSRAIDLACRLSVSDEFESDILRLDRERLLGTRLGQYELLACIGYGGMGTVYRARHQMLGRDVAVKVLSEDLTKDRQAIERFMREMQAIGKLNHPHIVKANDADKEDERYYLVMDLIEGYNFSQILRRVKTVAIPDVCELVRQTAIGLQYIHENQMVHR